MNPQAQLETAVAAAAEERLADDAKPFVLGNYIAVAETASATGPGLIVLAPVMTPEHLRMLTRAVDLIVSHFWVEDPTDEGEDVDAV